MPSALTRRALQSVSSKGSGTGTGLARAKKLADLAIKTNTDASGGYTSKGYEQAMAYLEPYGENIDAQRLLADYSNKLDKLSKKSKDQNETVAAFKLQEMDSYFTTFDGDTGGFRSPGSLIGTTSEALDNLLLGVMNAIDEKEAVGDSTDALHNYFNDLNKRAESMRGLRNKYEGGELTGKSLDGYGYYVDTDPVDGSVRSAALLPVGLAPEGMTTGYRRLDATTTVGDAALPVYAPAVKDATGAYTAKVGQATWTGSGEGALAPGKADHDLAKSLFAPGQFSIGDASNFPLRKNSVAKGGFGKGLIGKDADGNPVESVFYRGMDNKLYSVDETMLEEFKKDPMLAKKLDGYVTQFSPSEARDLSKEATPFSANRKGGAAREAQVAGYIAEADRTSAEGDRAMNRGFFGKIQDAVEGTTLPEREKMLAERDQKRAERNAIRANVTNRPTKPAAPVESKSPNDTVNKGKGFFRKIGSFFGTREVTVDNS